MAQKETHSGYPEQHDPLCKCLYEPFPPCVLFLVNNKSCNIFLWIQNYKKNCFHSLFQNCPRLLGELCVVLVLLPLLCCFPLFPLFSSITVSLSHSWWVLFCCTYQSPAPVWGDPFISSSGEPRITVCSIMPDFFRGYRYKDMSCLKISKISPGT